MCAACCDELGEEWREFCEVAKVEVFTYLDLTTNRKIF